MKFLNIAKLSQQKPANLSKFLQDIEKVKLAKYKEALGYKQRIQYEDIIVSRKIIFTIKKSGGTSFTNISQIKILHIWLFIPFHISHFSP